jgi:hypothetical protein
MAGVSELFSRIRELIKTFFKLDYNQRTHHGAVVSFLLQTENYHGAFQCAGKGEKPCRKL